MMPYIYILLAMVCYGSVLCLFCLGIYDYISYNIKYKVKRYSHIFLQSGITIITLSFYYGTINYTQPINHFVDDLIQFNNTPSISMEEKKQIFEIEKKNKIKITYVKDQSK